ncbi:MAG: AraC family transcriptional regulator [Flavobacteriaceae bacterium]
MDAAFSFIDIVIFVGICQGIFLSLTLQRIANNNKRANTILCWLIILSAFMLIGRFLMLRFFSPWVFMYSLFFDVTLFLFGPLFFLYVTRLLVKDTFTISKLHFLPALLFWGLTAYYFISYTSETYFQAYREGKLSLMFNTIIVLGITSNGYYLWKSFQVLFQFKKTEKQTFSFQQNPVKYLTFFLFSIAVILGAWAISYANATFFNRYFEYISYDIIWAVIPVFIYVIGYFSLKQPELFRIPEEKQKTTHKKERLPEAEAQLLQKKLDSLMINEKVFLQNDLTLTDVAEMLQTSSNNLSWLLNQVYKTTFYDFINQYRVQEFIKKVENQEHLKHTILALSMDVGFNSKSTFNKAFKDAMKDTPSNYIKKKQAA